MRRNASDDEQNHIKFCFSVLMQTFKNFFSGITNISLFGRRQIPLSSNPNSNSNANPTKIRGAGVVLTDPEGKKCLVLIRNPDYSKNSRKEKSYQFPGGKFDAKFDLLFVDVATREFFEETGILLAPSQFTQFNDAHSFTYSEGDAGNVRMYVVKARPGQMEKFDICQGALLLTFTNGMVNGVNTTMESMGMKWIEIDHLKADVNKFMEIKKNNPGLKLEEVIVPDSEKKLTLPLRPFVNEPTSKLIEMKLI